VLILNQSQAAGLAAEDGCDDSVSITTSRPACSTNLHPLNLRLGGSQPRAVFEAQVAVDAYESLHIIPKTNDSNTFQGGGYSQAPEAKRVTSTADAACLIISPDPLRQFMFGRCVARHGWQTIICPNPVATISHLAAGNVELALVDLAACSADDIANSGRFSVTLLSQQTNLLTIVCGQTRNPNEETWARSNGVWVYLPGVPPEADLDDILRSAKQISLNRLRQ
jgi:hypothetical protein